MNNNLWFLSGSLFLIEIVIWFGVGRMVYLWMNPSKRPKISLFVGFMATLGTIIFWGLFLSPYAAQRLALMPRTGIVAVISILTGFLLYRKGDRIFGLLTMTAVSIILVIGQLMLS